MNMNYLFGIIVAVAVLGVGYYAIDTDALDSTKTDQDAQQPVAMESGSTDTDTYQVDEGDFIDAAALLDTVAVGEITTKEIDGILFMREEEKLARDVYLTLYEQWGAQIFSNIAASEQTHMDSMLTLIERYDLTDPASAEAGVFTNPDLQQLYTDLVTEGSQSVAAAYRVGALIEDLDIKDLADTIAATDQSDIALVYENLQRGSRNHLRAFNQQLERVTGESYTPQFISEAEFAVIITSDTERGQRGGRRN